MAVLKIDCDQCIWECLTQGTWQVQERAKQSSHNGASANPEPVQRAPPAATASSMLITTAIVLVMAAILAVPFLSQASSSEAIT